MSDCSDTIQAGLNRSCKDIDQESLVRLMRYHSPGNVHQLENKIVRMDPLSQLAFANPHPDRLARRRAGWKGDTLGPLAQNGAQPNEVV